MSWRTMNKLLKSFRYAAAGIMACLRCEQNFRIHLTAVCCVLWMSRFYSFTRGEKALLAAVCGMVLAGELFNTAVERTVDMAAHGRHPLAKAAKDAAAGGVLAAAICAVIVGVFLFGQREPLAECLRFFLSRPSRFFLLAAAAAGAVLFVFTDWDRLLKSRKEHPPSGSQPF